MRKRLIQKVTFSVILLEVSRPSCAFRCYWGSVTVEICPTDSLTCCMMTVFVLFVRNCCFFCSEVPYWNETSEIFTEIKITFFNGFVNQDLIWSEFVCTSSGPIKCLLNLGGSLLFQNLRKPKRLCGCDLLDRLPRDASFRNRPAFPFLLVFILLSSRFPRPRRDVSSFHPSVIFRPHMLHLFRHILQSHTRVVYPETSGPSFRRTDSRCLAPENPSVPQRSEKMEGFSKSPKLAASAFSSWRKFPQNPSHCQRFARYGGNYS